MYHHHHHHQLADRTTTNKHVPVLAYGQITKEIITKVGASIGSSYGVTSNGTIYSWGSNMPMAYLEIRAYQLRVDDWLPGWFRILRE